MCHHEVQIPCNLTREKEEEEYASGKKINNPKQITRTQHLHHILSEYVAAKCARNSCTHKDKRHGCIPHVYSTQFRLNV